jgi:two-component system chemotaxis sensor kinase CheA
MAESTTNYLSALAQLTEKVAIELVYTSPGKDDGLLPINSLLSEMEEIAAQSPLLSPLPQGLNRARQAVDAAFERGGFEATQLHDITEWVKWMQEALPLAQAGNALPELPPPDTAGAGISAISISPAAAAEIVPSGMPPEEELLMNVEGDGDLLREFLNESGEHLQNIELGVLTLEENPTDADTLNSIFRAFHTFKGGSGFLNLLPMKNLAHELESLLDLARNHKLNVNSEIINVILEGGDTLKKYIAEMGAQLGGQKPVGPIVVPAQALLARVRVYLQNPGATTVVAPAAASSRVDAGQQVGASNRSPAPVAAPGSVVPTPTNVIPLTTPSNESTAPVPSQMSKPGSSVSREAAPARAGTNAVVKVDTQKLDALVDLVGEMVIAQSLIAADKDLASLQSQKLMRNLAQLGRITNELQRTAMSMRMVPIRATFQKMTRLVRDTAAKIGKQAELTMEGEDTELDRTIVEEISDPLIHMVRNSVDHGIEPPDVRITNGKPAAGTVRLRSFHQGGNIVIEIKDDGAGLNKDRLLAKAIEKGIVKQSEQLSEKEIFNLIFAPGFSTAAVVTDISGRGVGMDVVRKNIDKLRGKIEVQSNFGHGSTFTIFLPLTLAIIDGLIVSVGGERYILPTLSVRESFRPTQQMLSSVHARGEMVNVRGRLSPLLRLYEHFVVQPESPNPTEGILVVIEADGADRCILVDRLLGKQEVVIKSLGETFKQNPALAGAAILGDGRVGLILDVNALVKLKGTLSLADAA